MVFLATIQIDSCEIKDIAIFPLVETEEVIVSYVKKEQPNTLIIGKVKHGLDFLTAKR